MRSLYAACLCLFFTTQVTANEKITNEKIVNNPLRIKEQTVKQYQQEGCIHANVFYSPESPLIIGKKLYRCNRTQDGAHYRWQG